MLQSNKRDWLKELSVYLSSGYGLATASGPEVCYFKELDLSKTCILLNYRIK